MLGYLCSCFSGGTSNHLEYKHCLDMYLAASRNHCSLLQGADNNQDSPTCEHTGFELVSRVVAAQIWQQVFQVIRLIRTLPSSLSHLGLCDGFIRSSVPLSVCYLLCGIKKEMRTEHKHICSWFEFSARRRIYSSVLGDQCHILDGLTPVVRIH